MARPYSPGPKQFVFAVGDGNDQQVSVGDPQEAYVAFSAFFRDETLTPTPSMTNRRGRVWCSCPVKV